MYSQCLSICSTRKGSGLDSLQSFFGEQKERTKKLNQAMLNKRKSNPDEFRAKMKRENAERAMLVAARKEFKRTGKLNAEFVKRVRKKALTHYKALLKTAGSIKHFLGRERNVGFVLGEPYDALRNSLETALFDYTKHLEALHENPAGNLSVAPSKPELKRMLKA